VGGSGGGGGSTEGGCRNFDAGGFVGGVRGEGGGREGIGRICSGLRKKLITELLKIKTPQN
jgi:hypothetical protein